ncbi:hypothetical protein AB9N12_09630 [Bacteroides sp. AN502(2024)]|uniref:hypothetical protein n=1 Tax=Bacteroides sp. AN502(2024) TaxID=3160599 RepID=UPI00351244A2
MIERRMAGYIHRYPVIFFAFMVGSGADGYNPNLLDAKSEAMHHRAAVTTGLRTLKDNAIHKRGSLTNNVLSARRECAVMPTYTAETV